jgi:hypothetical protein
MADDTKPNSSATDTDARTGTERRAQAERRGPDRRQREEAGVPERRARERRKPGPDAERRKVERRINEYRMKPEVLEFINAVNHFKSVNQKPFPTWSEIYEVFLALGYRKVEE